MGASDFVVNVLREGYKIQFHSPPPLSDVPLTESVSNDPQKDSLIEEHIQLLLDKRALEIVHPPYSKGFYSRLFMVPKQGTNKWRPIIDLKSLNQLVVIPRFKMETILTIWKSLIPQNFCFSVDLTDAYLHVPMHKASRRYLRIVRGGKVYQFRVLPFGLSTAPWIFTQVVQEVKKMLHVQNILMHIYLDDWLVQVTSFSLGQTQSDYLVQLCHRLGLIVNQEKSELIPTQDFSFIGAHFNLFLERVFPQQKNIEKVQKAVSKFLQNPDQTAQSWQSLIGTLNAQYRFIHIARLFTRPIQWFLMDSWRQGVGDPHQVVSFPLHLNRYLEWWMDQVENPVGVPLIQPEYTLRMFTDASTTGWGAHVEGLMYQGDWSREESRLHINVLELRAVVNAVIHHNPPQGSVILTSTDNTTVMAYINRQGGTHSRELMEETFRLYMILEERDIQIRAQYIPGRLNVIADQLSRKGQNLPTEWSIHQEAIDRVFSMWLRPLIDLFATRHNSKCPMFVSPVPDPLALDVDALSLVWEGMEAYAYPPHQILSNVLQKFQLCKNCKLIVVAPYWQKQTWLPLLNQLAVCPPYRFPYWKKLLRQPLSHSFHPNPEFLDLHAWMLVRGNC